MNIIEKYFRKKADKVSFIELKENIDYYRNYGIEDIPLPIILDDMMDGMTHNEFDNEIKIEYIIDGMLYMVAIDPEFLYVNEYKHILGKLLDDSSKYALSKAVKFYDTNFEKALLFTRAAFLLNEENEMAAYSYAKLLWNIEVSKEDREIFIEQSIRILERILRYNETYSLANFELGNISKATGKYIKANNFYNRALRNAEFEELKDTIRDEMNKIAPDVAVENSIYYINKMDYSTAISELMEARKNSSRYDIPYYIAIAYMNKENPELAEQFFEESIEKGADFAMLYTDLVYIKYVLKKDVEALHLANDSIEKYPSEIKLRYNRAIILMSINKFDKAIEDFDFILEYQDLSDEMFNQIMKIKESIMNR
ncbi:MULTISPECIES: tetratricopeptide repeat protein [Helcococcus]|uniref:Tetratricopeptide repeat protein n=1 Tax=Helcococcus bovis TaxID=3153252 RepID=A0ABW9F4V9_9FIRM